MEHFGWVLAVFILIGISAIILPYLWYRFWKLRHHFLIAARFPKVTLSMSILMFVNGVAATINLFILSIYNFDHDKGRSINYRITFAIEMTLSFLFCFILVYRSFLIFNQWANQEIALQNKNSIIVHAFKSQSQAITMDVIKTSVKDLKHENVHRRMKRFVISILIISMVLFLITLPSVFITKLEIQRKLFAAPFIIIIVLGMFVVNQSRKMNESILYQRETYMIASLVLLNIAAESTQFGVYVSYVNGALLALFASYGMVILSLWMVYKNMGNVSGARSYGISLSTSESAEGPKPSKPAKKKKKIPLYRYLDMSINEYNEFSEFLVSCFAIENLLFFVKAITFRHIVSEISETLTDSNVADLEGGISSFQLSDLLDSRKSIVCDISKRQSTMDKVFAMEFNYLDKGNDTSSIQEIVANMYDLYIWEEGKYQVNIPSVQREKIEMFIKDQHEVSEYLNLFDEAIEEVYGMLTNVYRFQFKAESRYGTL